MKKIKQIGNKFLAVLLTAAMVFALSPLPAEAAVSNNSMPEVYVYERRSSGMERKKIPLPG